MRVGINALYDASVEAQTGGKCEAAAVDDAEVDLGGMIPHPRLAAEAATMRPADLLAVGLTARGATIGALVMIRSEGRGFDARDVTVAEVIPSVRTHLDEMLAWAPYDATPDYEPRPEPGRQPLRVPVLNPLA